MQVRIIIRRHESLIYSCSELSHTSRSIFTQKKRADVCARCGMKVSMSNLGQA